MALMRRNSSSLPASAPVVVASGTDKRKQRTLAKQQQISETIAGVAMTILENAQESVSAIEELKSSMEQIATAAEENSGASEQALTNVKSINTNIKRMNVAIDTVISSTLSAGDNIMASVQKNDSSPSQSRKLWRYGMRKISRHNIIHKFTGTPNRFPIREAYE